MSVFTTQRRVRAVLFDLDGTLYDSAPDLAASANRLRERDGLPPLPLADYRPHASSGARGMLQVAFGLTPDDARFAALRAEFIADYADHLLDHGRVFDGVLPLLQALQHAGLPWAVVTRAFDGPIGGAPRLAAGRWRGGVWRQHAPHQAPPGTGAAGGAALGRGRRRLCDGGRRPARRASRPGRWRSHRGRALRLPGHRSAD